MTGELDRLERDVELSRDRLSGNLAALRSPTVYSDFLQTLKDTAVEAKDSVVDDVKARSRSALEDAVELAKAKAAANPAATLVVALGVGWHLLRNPPIAAVLVGGGLLSLFRTPANGPSRDTSEHLATAADNLREQAGDMAQAAGDAVQRGATYLKDRASVVSREVAHSAGSVAAQASDLTEAAGDAVQRGATYLKDRASEVSREVADAAGAVAAQASDLSEAAIARMVPHSQPPSRPGLADQHFETHRQFQPHRSPTARMKTFADEHLPAALPADRVLLGAAGLAVGTALAIALYRRQEAKAPPPQRRPRRARRT